MSWYNPGQDYTRLWEELCLKAERWEDAWKWETARVVLLTRGGNVHGEAGEVSKDQLELV